LRLVGSSRNASRLAPGACQIATLADVVDRQHEAFLAQDPQTRGLSDGEAVLVAGQPGDLAVAPTSGT